MSIVSKAIRALEKYNRLPEKKQLTHYGDYLLSVIRYAAPDMARLLKRALPYLNALWFLRGVGVDGIDLSDDLDNIIAEIEGKEAEG